MALPQTEYTNEQFIQKYNLDSTSEWIEQMTGIKARRFVQDHNEFEVLALRAVEEAIKDIDINSIDGLILATSTNFYHFPGLSHIVHNKLGMKQQMRVFDLNAACNGFMQALALADLWVKYDGMQNVVVVGAEAMSSILNMEDRSTCCLFGDGVGAMLVGKSSQGGILSSAHVAIAEKYEALIAEKHIVMNGRAVFESSLKYFQEVINTALQKANMCYEDVDYFILHQANKRILQSLAKYMQIDEAKVPFLAEFSANTSAATIPIALAQLNITNKTILLAGFGAGFTASAILITY